VEIQARIVIDKAVCKEENCRPSYRPDPCFDFMCQASNFRPHFKTLRGFPSYTKRVLAGSMTYIPNRALVIGGMEGRLFPA
jgi:hypothetical protein